MRRQTDSGAYELQAERMDRLSWLISGERERLREEIIPSRRKERTIDKHLYSFGCELLHYSSIHLTQSQFPFKSSFHRLTLLSPPLTARTFPLKLQLTLQTTASNSGSTVHFHSPSVLGSCVHILTVLSCDALAMYDFERTVGAHATSRTQSVWPVRVFVVS